MSMIGQVEGTPGTDAAGRGAVDPFAMDVRQVQGGQPVNEAAGTTLVLTAVAVSATKYIVTIAAGC